MSKPTLPRSVVYEVTGRCDLRCAHCYNVWTAPGAERPRDLERADALRIPNRLRPLGRKLESVNLTGGEPLLRNDIEEIVARFRETFPRAQVNVATNGRGLTSARARALAAAGVAAIQLTLLAPDPERHDAMTGRPGSFDRTLAAIADANAAGLAVAVFFVATRENIAVFPGTARLARALGADAFVFNRVQPGGRGLVGWRERNPTPGQIVEALDRLEEIREIVDVTFGTMIPPCESGGRSGTVPDLTCPIGTRDAYPTIGPDGTVRPCNHDPRVLGSLLEEDLASLLRKAGPCRSARPPECADCTDWRRCGGGCPAARELAAERIYGVEEMSVPGLSAERGEGS